MKQGIPAIWEEASQLRKLMQHQPDSLRRTRLHLLYLLRTQAAMTRQQAAQLLGVRRETVGDWLGLYERGGLAALLQVGHAPGKAPSLPPDVTAGMRAKLAEPMGYASFHELHRSRRANLSSQNHLSRHLVHGHPGLGRTACCRRPHTHQKSPTSRRVFAPPSPIGSAKRR